MLVIGMLKSFRLKFVLKHKIAIYHGVVQILLHMLQPRMKGLFFLNVVL